MLYLFFLYLNLLFDYIKIDILLYYLFLLTFLQFVNLRLQMLQFHIQFIILID